MAQVTAEVRVRYAETDAMGVVYHANYLAWFEVGRTEWLRQQGVPYTEFEARGLFVPVVEVQARYLSPARYDDVLQIETTVSDLSPARVTFAYRISREGVLLCEGRSNHGFMSRESGRPVALARKAPDLYTLLERSGADR